MKYKITKSKHWQSSFVLGMYRYYDKNDTNSYLEVIQALKDAQGKVKDKFGFLLSTKVSKCEIIAEEQKEESIEFMFINHPKYLQKNSLLEKAVLFIAKDLMTSLKQNRTIITFPSEMIMLEEYPEKVDEGITS